MVEKEKINESELKEKSKKLSIQEGSGYGVMNGFGLRYITPYALALGASNTIIGLLSSLPPFLGTLSQIQSSKLIEKIQRKKIVVYSVALQALMWLPLIFIGILYFFFGVSSLVSSLLLLIVYSMLILAGSFCNPAWSSWMKDLAGNNPSEYFGKRTKIITLVELICMLFAGLILDHFKKTGVFKGFLILFAIAFIGRVVSAYLLNKKHEPKIIQIEGYYFSFFQFLKKMRHNNFGKFVIFTTLISFATAIASPFFAVYMLKDLGLNYYEFTLISITNIATIVIMLPLWGKFASKYGNIAVIKISGSFIAFIPILWMLSPIVLAYNSILLIPYLLLIETFSGFWWSGLNLSTANFVYDAVTKERMALCIAYDNITTAFGVFIGAIIGGVISSISFPILGLKPILFVFLLSGVLRALVAIIMLPKLKEVRNVEEFKIGAIKTKIMLIPKYMHIGIRRPGYQQTQVLG
ncbi:MAG: MFS transporter [Nanoarchaeota archaeon]